jgi:hypothetical protein
MDVEKPRLPFVLINEFCDSFEKVSFRVPSYLLASDCLLQFRNTSEEQRNMQLFAFTMVCFVLSRFAHS